MNLMNLQTFLAGAAVALVFSASTFAQSLVHRWDMNSVNDSVGTSNGTLVNGASLSGGSLVLDPLVNTNSGINAPALSLPTTAVEGLSGSFSIETWFTFNELGLVYTTLFSFSDGTTNSYIIGTPNRGDSGGIASIAFKNGGEPEARIDIPNLTGGLSYQFVATFDASANTGYAFLNGLLIGSVSLDSLNMLPYNLSTFNQLGIGGLAPYGDRGLEGTVQDFRIYDGALSDSQVATLFSLGANATNSEIISAVPEPSSVGLAMAAGLGALALYRRPRQS